MDKRTVAASMRAKAAIWRDMGDIERLTGQRNSGQQRHRDAAAHFEAESIYRKVAKELMDYAVAVEAIATPTPLAEAIGRVAFSPAPLTQRSATR